MKPGEHMRAQAVSISKLIQQLPPNSQNEVRDFVILLLEKRNKKSHAKPTFAWAGALKELSDQYTSVELQHQISSWRTGHK
jgi:hypothetical protein